MCSWRCENAIQRGACAAPRDGASRLGHPLPPSRVTGTSQTARSTVPPWHSADKRAVMGFLGAQGATCPGGRTPGPTNRPRRPRACEGFSGAGCSVTDVRHRCVRRRPMRPLSRCREGSQDRASRVAIFNGGDSGSASTTCLSSARPPSPAIGRTASVSRLSAWFPSSNMRTAAFSCGINALDCYEDRPISFPVSMDATDSN